MTGNLSGYPAHFVNIPQYPPLIVAAMIVLTIALTVFVLAAPRRCNGTMTTAGTFYDGPAVTLSAGTWQLHGTITLTVFVLAAPRR